MAAGICIPGQYHAITLYPVCFNSWVNYSIINRCTNHQGRISQPHEKFKKRLMIECIAKAAKKCVANAERYSASSADKAKMIDNREMLIQCEAMAVVSK